MLEDREAWYSALHGVTKGQTQLSNWTIVERTKQTFWPTQYITVLKMDTSSVNLDAFITIVIGQVMISEARAEKAM